LGKSLDSLDFVVYHFTNCGIQF